MLSFLAIHNSYSNVCWHSSLNTGNLLTEGFTVLSGNLILLQVQSNLTDGNYEDPNSAQKVPPLRIKFASGASSEADPSLQTTPTAANSSGNGDNPLFSSETTKNSDRENAGSARDPRSENNTNDVTGLSGAMDQSNTTCSVTMHHEYNQDPSVSMKGLPDTVTAVSTKHKFLDGGRTDPHRGGLDHAGSIVTVMEADNDEIRNSTNSAQPSEDAQVVESVHEKTDSDNGHETGKDTLSSKVSLRSTYLRFRYSNVLLFCNRVPFLPLFYLVADLKGRINLICASPAVVQWMDILSFRSSSNLIPDQQVILRGLTASGFRATRCYLVHGSRVWFCTIPSGCR